MRDAEPGTEYFVNVYWFDRETDDSKDHRCFMATLFHGEIGGEIACHENTPNLRDGPVRSCVTCFVRVFALLGDGGFPMDLAAELVQESIDINEMVVTTKIGATVVSEVGEFMGIVFLPEKPPLSIVG